MRRTLSRLFRQTPLWPVYYRLKLRLLARSQSDESRIIRQLAAGGPRTFIEFGFHPHEYNCVGLDDYAGLLIDGDAATVRLARLVLPRRIRVEQCFLDRDNLGLVTAQFPALGVLSIDIDGNDYWMAEALLPLRPGVLAVEYNASLGRRSLTVPYDPTFVRHTQHPSGWYHGASLAALTRLAERHGYKLAAVSAGGMNAFFVPASRTDVSALDPEAAYRENTLRNQWSGQDAAGQWAVIRDLPFVEV